MRDLQSLRLAVYPRVPDDRAAEELCRNLANSMASTETLFDAAVLSLGAIKHRIERFDLDVRGAQDGELCEFAREIARAWCT